MTNCSKIRDGFLFVHPVILSNGNHLSKQIVSDFHVCLQIARAEDCGLRQPVEDFKLEVILVLTSRRFIFFKDLNCILALEENELLIKCRVLLVSNLPKICLLHALDSNP